MQMFSYQAEKSGLDGHEALPCPLVGVSVTLPDSVVFLEAPQVARWDAAGISHSEIHIKKTPQSQRY